MNQPAQGGDTTGFEQPLNPPTERDWRYFSEALAWYEPHRGLTGAQTFGVVQQVQAALRDGRITPGDLGMMRVHPAGASGLLDVRDREVWQIEGGPNAS